MRVLVCGGRGYSDRARVYEVLDGLVGVTVLIHGGGTGADVLAGEWAMGRGVQVIEYMADWDRHGRSAGPRRNAQMLRDGRVDLVIAFPGGEGTADMVRRARVEW
jgi:hypothetical protein